jgi:hypothetical protein
VQLASLFGLVSERLSVLEGKVEQQDTLIMELTYQVKEAQGKAQSLPFISGRFGYGVGRNASHRVVLLFAKQAQTGKERDQWPTNFLGKYKTDGNGACPSLWWCVTNDAFWTYFCETMCSNALLQILGWQKCYPKDRPAVCKADTEWQGAR